MLQTTILMKLGHSALSLFRSGEEYIGSYGIHRGCPFNVGALFKGTLGTLHVVGQVCHAVYQSKLAPR